MKRLKLLVEGQTEYECVKAVLWEHFYGIGLQIEPIIVVTGKSKTTGGSKRGGVSRYALIKRDMNPILHECRTPDVWASTLFDLYALPSDFPGKADAPSDDPYRRITHIEQAFARDWESHPRGSCLVPYIQLHEIEALLLSDVSAFAEEFIEAEEAKGIQGLRKEVEVFASPEEINEGSKTSPSKRIIRHLPDYANRKSSAAAAIAPKVGLARMRESCPHFNEWVTRLEGLSVL